MTKLKKGQTFKNYKELCGFMGWKQTRGNYMKARLKELETLCKYHKEGNKFIIDEVYDKPLEKVDNRVNNGTNSIYANDIEKLIIDMCSVSDSNSYDDIQLSLNGLLLALNIINNNYSIASYNQTKLSQYLKIPVETIGDFFNSTYSKNKGIIEGALNTMQRKCLINWTTIIRIKTNEGDYRKATNVERKQIVNTEKEALNELGYTDKKDVFLDGKWNVFFNLVKNKLKEDSYIVDYYKAYSIVTSDAFDEMLLENREKNSVLSNLNKNITDSAIKSANKRHDKALAKKENTLGKMKYTKDENRASNDYIWDTTTLVNLVLKENSDIDLNYLHTIECDKAYSYKQSLKDKYKRDNDATDEEVDLLFD